MTKALTTATLLQHSALPPRVKIVTATDAAAVSLRHISAEAFAERVFDLTRIDPLVVVSAERGGHLLIDVFRLAERLEERADIAVIADDAAGRALSPLLEPLHVWGGAIRIYHADATPDDPREEHPVVRVTQGRSQTALNRIIAFVEEAAHQTLTPRAVGPINPHDAFPQGAPHMRVVADRPERDTELDKLAANANDLRHENNNLKDALRNEQRRARDLRQQVKALQRQLGAASTAPRLARAGVYADPEQQFRYEVEQWWLTALAEPERNDLPLATYRLGRDWHDSLKNHQEINHEKLVEVVVEVLTKRARRSPGREVRDIRANKSGDAPQLVRQGDHACAWRCNIDNHAPNASRLMWWRLPDGTIELACVDDKNDRVTLH